MEDRTILIKIMGIEFKVKFTEDNCKTDNYMGRADTKSAEISISESMPPDNQKLTLLHETIHCINEMLSLKLKEEQVTSLATGLFDVIKNNNLFLQFLYDNDCNFFRMR